MNRGKIELHFELLSPLSHIGESSGIDCFLNRQKMLINGEIEEVFVYNGNAIRGVLRDLISSHLLDYKKTQVPLETFYLLFSGGNISGEQKIDIKQSRDLREKLPIISIFGGGTGNQILSGKIKVSDALVKSVETKSFLPNTCHVDCNNSWGEHLSYRYYTRFDDSKDFNKHKYISDINLVDEGKTKKTNEASMQMRYGVEVLVPGAKLYSKIFYNNLNDTELNCLMTGIGELIDNPYLGGKSNVGLGECKINVILNGEEVTDFEKYKSEYEEFLNGVEIC